MKRNIQIQNISYTYSLRRNRLSKNVRLIVHEDGNLVVTAPKWTSIRYIETFLLEKSSWLQKVLQGADIKEKIKSEEEAKRQYQIYKQQAYLFICEKLELYNHLYNFSYNKVSIRNQRSRWGSCSSKGNLSFNYKILFLPDELADYLVVHELCHLQEMNHSKKFWTLVEISTPDYRQRIRALRRYERECL